MIVFQAEVFFISLIYDNFLPFLLWGLLIMVLLILGAIPLGLGLLVAVPMLWASTYAAFRDIYYAD